MSENECRSLRKILVPKLQGRRRKGLLRDTRIYNRHLPIRGTDLAKRRSGEIFQFGYLRAESQRVKKPRMDRIEQLHAN